MAPVVVVANPAAALSPGVGSNFRQYELRNLPDVYAGETAAEQAANMDAGRNSQGLAAGTLAPNATPLATTANQRWKAVGGTASSLFSSIFFMPQIFQLGDALTNGYVSTQAKADCKLPDTFFGVLSKWAAGVAGFSCDATADAPTKDPGYVPQYKGQAGPAGLPVTLVAPTYTAGSSSYTGSVSWGTPYWSTKTFTLRDGTHTAQEGWVYPVSWSGSYYSSIVPPTLNITLLSRAAGGSISKTYTNVGSRTTPGGGATPCTAQLCLSVTRLLDYVGQNDGSDALLLANGDGAISSISADTGGTRVTTQALVPPPQYSVNAAAGAPNTSGAAPPVKLRTIETSVSGKTAQCDSASFLETDTIIPKPCEPSLPSDWGVTAHRTVEIVPSTTDAPTVISDYDTSPGYQTQESQYPQCATQVCLLTLTRIAGSPTGECSDFSTDPNPCADWFSDTNKNDDYQCQYAGQTVALDKCDTYSTLYKPDAITQGQAYADPTTGAEPGPGTITSRPPVPSEGPGPVTPPDPTTGSTSCFPTGWSAFNPVQWVLMPVKCALEWAFVPQPSTFTNLQTNVQAQWRLTELAKIGAALNLSSVTGGSGCGGIPLDLSALVPAGTGGNTHITILNSCSAPFDSWAALSTVALTIMFSVIGIMGVTRNLGMIFGQPGIGAGSED